MSTPPMMKCGHQANATQDSKPVCVICAMINPDATVVDDSPPDLSVRTAKCTYCSRTANSDGSGSGFSYLPFFEYRPDAEFDRYYCGCRGWD